MRAAQPKQTTAQQQHHHFHHQQQPSWLKRTVPHVPAPSACSRQKTQASLPRGRSSSVTGAAGPLPLAMASLPCRRSSSVARRLSRGTPRCRRQSRAAAAQQQQHKGSRAFVVGHADRGAPKEGDPAKEDVDHAAAARDDEFTKYAQEDPAQEGDLAKEDDIAKEDGLAKGDLTNLGDYPEPDRGGTPAEPPSLGDASDEVEGKNEGMCQECGHCTALAVLRDCGRCEARAICPLCMLDHDCPGPERTLEARSCQAATQRPGRSRCARCRAHRPGERRTCPDCNRRVGPGCAPPEGPCWDANAGRCVDCVPVPAGEGATAAGTGSVDTAGQCAFGRPCGQRACARSTLASAWTPSARATTLAGREARAATSSRPAS